MRLTISVFLVAAGCYSSLAPTVSAYVPSSRQWGVPKTGRSPLIMKQEGGKDGSFSLANLFGGDGNSSPAVRGSKKLAPHPSVNPHISPLNRLGPDKVKESKSEPLPVHSEVRSGTLPNGLPYIILPNASPAGRFEAHLQVFSGSGMWMLILSSDWMLLSELWSIFLCEC